MPIERNALSTTKDRVLTVDLDGVVVKSVEVNDLLAELLREMRMVRQILAEGFEIDLEPEELEEIG